MLQILQLSKENELEQLLANGLEGIDVTMYKCEDATKDIEAEVQVKLDQVFIFLPKLLILIEKLKINEYEINCYTYIFAKCIADKCKSSA